nr:zinc finger, CCHC-type [Tanacetum cinerariifolium]
MGDENPILTLRDYSKPSQEGYRNTIELPVGNNVVPLRFDIILLVQNGCSFHGLRSEDPNQHLKDFLKFMDSLDLDVSNRERARLRLFPFSLYDQANIWIECLPAGSISTWEDLTTRFFAQFFPPRRTKKLCNDILMFQQHQGESLSEAWTRWLRKISAEKAWATIEELARYEDEGWNDLKAISLMGRRESVFRMTRNTVYQLPLEPSRQEEFENLVMNFILDQEEKVKQLKEYMGVMGSDFMQLSLEVVGKLKEEIRMVKNRVKKTEKIMRYPHTKDLEPLNDCKFSETLTKKASFHTPKSVSPKSLCSKHVRTIFPSPPLKPQRQSLTNFPSLDISLGKERGPKPHIKPYSPDSFRMNVVDNLTIHTPPSPHMASFHLKDLYCYFHPCIDDPKKLYGFKLGLLGHSGSLGVIFSNLEMIEDDWELESKEVYFLGRGLNLPVRPKKVENV